MKLYHVQFQILSDIAVFAMDHDEAEQLVMLYLTYNYADGAAYTISLPVKREHLTAEENQSLRELSRAGSSGFGFYHTYRGWEIMTVKDFPFAVKSERSHRKPRDARTAIYAKGNSNAFDYL